MGKMKHVALTIRWIGEDAQKAADAYDAGDYDLLKACLDSIQYYAADLGYQPVAPKEGDDVQEARTEQLGDLCRETFV